MLRTAIVFALPILVVINHFYQITVNDLSIWKGGGMGMFASFDSPAERFLTIEIAGAGAQGAPLRLKPAGSIAQAVSGMVTIPTDERLARICALVADGGVISNDRIFGAGDAALAAAPMPQKVRELGQAEATLTVFNTVYDPETQQLGAVVLNSGQFTIAEGVCDGA
ncbi:MAG: hypothetical protein AAF675_19660 [Pseudomonadota bacterium]